MTADPLTYHILAEDDSHALLRVDRASWLDWFTQRGVVAVDCTVIKPGLIVHTLFLGLGQRMFESLVSRRGEIETAGFYANWDDAAHGHVALVRHVAAYAGGRPPDDEPAAFTCVDCGTEVHLFGDMAHHPRQRCAICEVLITIDPLTYRYTAAASLLGEQELQQWKTSDGAKPAIGASLPPS